MSPAALARMLAFQTRAQALSFLRVPALSVTCLGLPLMLYGFFALPHARDAFPDGTPIGARMLCSLGAYATANLMVFTFGVQIASERAQKVDLLLRATPLPAWVSLGARTLTALAFGLLAIGSLAALAATAGGVAMAAGAWVGLVARLLLGALPFVAFGFAVGYGLSPNAAPAVANFGFLVMAFASGMFVPVEQLPGPVRDAAGWLPTWHYLQLATGAISAGAEPTATSAAWLAAWTAVLMALTFVAYRREVGRRFA